MPGRFFFLLLLSLAAAMHHGLAQAFDPASRGGPSLTVAGTYFPAWLVCSVVGVAVAIVAHGVRIAAWLTPSPPMQLLVCLSFGAIAGALAWVVWVGL